MASASPAAISVVGVRALESPGTCRPLLSEGTCSSRSRGVREAYWGRCGHSVGEEDRPGAWGRS